MEGRIGRNRAYTCTVCGKEFQVFTINPLPIIDQACPQCKDSTYRYTFTSKLSGKDTLIRARGVELATLKAFQISPNLTFKIPQPMEAR